MISESRSRGIRILGWTVISANVLLGVVYYFDLSALSSPAVERMTSFISMLAVFPYDFFCAYFSTQWPLQMIWGMVVLMSAFGILLLNKISRIIFILLNVFQVVVLAYLVFSKLHTAEILYYIFEMYFTAVASGTYITYLTLPEVRRQFYTEMAELKFQILLQKFMGKPIAPSDAKKYAGLSAAYLRLERYEEAADSIQKAIQGDAENAEYYFRLGMIQIKQRLFTEAIGSFKQATVKDPLHYEAYCNLGILYVQQGCSREALEFFQRAVHVRPRDPQVYRELGDTYFSLGEYSKAADHFQQAIALSKKDVYSYYRRGCILEEYLDRHQEALESLRAAVRIDNGFCDAHFHLGKVCIKLKRYKDAVREFKEVIVLQKDHVQGHYYIGFVYVMLKDFRSARRHCSFLERYDPDLANNLSLLLSSS